MTGWNLPPGCTSRMIDEAMGAECPCEMCGRWADDCLCPECPKCGEYGNPHCYREHGLVCSAIQIASLAESTEAERKANEEANARYYAAYAEAEYWGYVLEGDLSNAIGWASRSI